jgi:hypothetical protein
LCDDEINPCHVIDDMRYDSLPSDSNFDGHMMGRFGSYGHSYQSSAASSSVGGADSSMGSDGGVWAFGK